MVVGIGIDSVEVARMQEVLRRWDWRFYRRLFSQHEIDHCRSKVNSAECFAVRFAAKEALAKALGHGWCEHFSWTDVEVRNDASGKPYFEIRGKTRKLVADRRVFLSLSHTKTQAVAMVVIEREGENDSNVL